MGHAADVVIYLGIALASVLPAVYAIALQSTVSSIEAEKRVTTAAVESLESELTQLMVGHVPNLGVGGVDDLKAKIAEVQKDRTRVHNEARLLSISSAFTLPMALWLFAIGSAAFARFYMVGNAKRVVLVVSVVFVLAGVVQLWRVLKTAQRFETAKAPALQLNLDGDADANPLRWKVGIRTSLDAELFNSGTVTTNSTQIRLRAPMSMHWHGNKTWVDADGKMGTINSQSFNLKAYNTYGYHFYVTPNAIGEFCLELRAVSDEFYGPVQRLKVIVEP